MAWCDRVEGFLCTACNTWYSEGDEDQAEACCSDKSGFGRVRPWRGWKCTECGEEFQDLEEARDCCPDYNR